MSTKREERARDRLDEIGTRARRIEQEQAKVIADREKAIVAAYPLLPPTEIAERAGVSRQTVHLFVKRAGKTAAAR